MSIHTKNLSVVPLGVWSIIARLKKIGLIESAATVGVDQLARVTERIFQTVPGVYILVGRGTHDKTLEGVVLYAGCSGDLGQRLLAHLDALGQVEPPKYKKTGIWAWISRIPALAALSATQRLQSVQVVIATVRPNRGNRPMCDIRFQYRCAEDILIHELKPVGNIQGATKSYQAFSSASQRRLQHVDSDYDAYPTRFQKTPPEMGSPLEVLLRMNFPIQ